MIDYKTKTIAIEWCIDDVQNVRPYLTDEQAWEVLKAIVDRHDANIGVNWDYIEAVADDMFDEPDNEGSENE